MPDMPQKSTLEPDLVHRFKNHLSIIVGFCDLLLAEASEGDTRRADLTEIQKAAYAAIALMPELSKRLR